MSNDNTSTDEYAAERRLFDRRVAAEIVGAMASQDMSVAQLAESLSVPERVVWRILKRMIDGRFGAGAELIDVATALGRRVIPTAHAMSPPKMGEKANV